MYASGWIQMFFFYLLRWGKGQRFKHQYVTGPVGSISLAFIIKMMAEQGWDRAACQVCVNFVKRNPPISLDSVANLLPDDHSLLHHELSKHPDADFGDPPPPTESLTAS